MTVTTEFLDAALDAVEQARCECITLNEVPSRLSAPRAGRPFVCFTFDDGYRDNLVPRFINTDTYRLGRHFVELAFGIPGSHPCEQSVQVGTGEFPFERLRDAFIVALEARQPLSDRFQAGEIVRREHFSLHDGEVDLDLVEPARVHRPMHRHQPGMSLGQPLDRTLASRPNTFARWTSRAAR